MVIWVTSKIEQKDELYKETKKKKKKVSTKQ